MKINKLKVNEIFFSCQGESDNIGIPTLFIRLTGCNLKCSWCDTAYARKEGKNMNKDQILKILTQYPNIHRCVSGGEPLLQQKELAVIIGSESEKYWEIETNGTIEPTNILFFLINHWNVSPKLSSSGEPYEHRIKEDVLRKFNEIPNCSFKFVVQTKKDFNEMLEIIKKLNLNKKKIIVMPEGTNMKTLRRRSLWIVEECKKHDFRFLPRLQIFLWGKKRGR